MSTGSQQEPGPLAAFQQAISQLAESLNNAGLIMTAQGAYGWVHRGDLGQARKQLESLPAPVLQQVAVAAAALSSLADEVAAEKTPD